MHSLLDFLHRIRDVRAIIAWGGYVGLTAIIFAETGLLIGFFLPGDSLIVTAGLLAATTGVFNVWGSGALLTVASILGNTVGLRDRQGDRPATVLARRFPAVQQEASVPRSRVLRTAWRQDRHHCAIHADRPDVRARRGRYGGKWSTAATRSTTLPAASAGSGACCSSATSWVATFRESTSISRR